MERLIDFRGHKTWCLITGEGAAGRLPVIILHGGPGAAHDYTLSMRGLSGDGRVVIHYDQLGCGRSTHLPDAAPDFWTVELFVDEFANLVEALGLDEFHLLGQSWGGMLAAEIAVRRPAGLASLTICDSPASSRLWAQAADELRAGLPLEVQQTLTRHETAGTTDSPEYRAACRVYYDRHVCRIVPNPPELTATFDQIDADPTVYHTMNGPSEFFMIGTLRDWDITDRLDRIAVPTLVIAGEHDEATPETWKPFVEGIPDVRSHVFPGASHCPHLERPDDFLEIVGGFLRTVER